MNDFSKSSLVRSEQNLQNYQLTEIGYIPRDWNVLKLESLVTYRNGVAHEDCIETSGEYVVVNSKFISTDGDVKKYSSQCRLSAFSREILMVMSDVPNGKAIAKCYFVKDDDLLTINQRICALKSINSDSKYLFYVLNRNAFYLAFDDGAKQTNLRRQDVLDCPIVIPSRQEEQTAIANALSDVDALIQELEKLIAKKQAIKTATMQQLLTGRTRLPQFAHHPDGRKKGYKPSELGEIPEDWIKNKLGNIAPLQRGFDLPSTARCDGQYPVVYSNGIVNTHNKYQVKGPGVVTGRSGTLGKVHYIEQDYWPHNTSLWVTKFNQCDPKFIFFLFSLIGFERFASGSGVPTLNRNDAHCFELTLPSTVDEQIAISTILTDMDKEIEGLELRLSKTRQIKQGMMQELLTGKTRLVKPAGAA